MFIGGLPSFEEKGRTEEWWGWEVRGRNWEERSGEEGSYNLDVRQIN